MKVAGVQHDIEWEDRDATLARLEPQLRAAAGTGRPVNRLLLAGPGGDLWHYDKIHPFSYSGEHEHYSAGTERVTFDVEGVRVTPFVCYDLRFADEFWAMASGTDCYVVVANWPA